MVLVGSQPKCMSGPGAALAGNERRLVRQSSGDVVLVPALANGGA